MSEFNLKVSVNPGGTSSNIIVGNLNQFPGTRPEVEDMRDNLYPKIMRINYFVLFNKGMEIWVSPKILEGAVITFEIVRN